MIPNVLSIAGSDPSGGAGIQADLKAISANRGFAMAAVTALTAQNTQGVTGIHLTPPDFVKSQIDTVFADIQVDAVKIGMIANAEIAAAVAMALKTKETPIVLDPVMIAKGGAALLQDDAIETLRNVLVPLAQVITPNLPEAACLLEQPKATTLDQMENQAHALTKLGSAAALVKGGHLTENDSPDCLALNGETFWFTSPRHTTKNTHGTGCTLSAALATQIAHGHSLPKAVANAKTFVTQAIRNADVLEVGHGHGPTHHFASLWA